MSWLRSYSEVTHGGTLLPKVTVKSPKVTVRQISRAVIPRPTLSSRWRGACVSWALGLTQIQTAGLWGWKGCRGVTCPRSSRGAWHGVRTHEVAWPLSGPLLDPMAATQPRSVWLCQV